MLCVDATAGALTRLLPVQLLATSTYMHQSNASLVCTVQVPFKSGSEPALALSYPPGSRHLACQVNTSQKQARVLQGNMTTVYLMDTLPGS